MNLREALKGYTESTIVKVTQLIPKSIYGGPYRNGEIVTSHMGNILFEYPHLMDAEIAYKYVAYNHETKDPYVIIELACIGYKNEAVYAQAMVDAYKEVKL